MHIALKNNRMTVFCKNKTRKHKNIQVGKTTENG